MTFRNVIISVLFSLLVLLNISCVESQNTFSRKVSPEEYEFPPECYFGGIHLGNSDLTEPRAVSGKYLKVIGGGVAVIKGRDAAFYLEVELNNKIEKDIYAVIKYENPLDKG